MSQLFQFKSATATSIEYAGADYLYIINNTAWTNIDIDTIEFGQLLNIVAKVNNEEIDHFKALSLMKGAYLRSPNNPRVVKNFITLIRFNLMDMLNDQTRKTTEIYTILDWVKNNMSQTYKQNSNELSKARREILQQLKQGGVDISLLDDENPLSRLNLNFGQSLNAQGLKMKKVLTYLKELGNEQTSSNQLDALSRLRQQLNLDNDDFPF